LGSYENGNKYLNKGNIRDGEKRVLNMDKNKRMACVKNKTRKKQEHLGGEEKDIKSEQ